MLTSSQNQIHSEMLMLSRDHRTIESRIIETLRQVEREKVYRALGFPSLFVYCVRALGFTESVSYAFIAVMRKSGQVPALAAALSEWLTRHDPLEKAKRAEARSSERARSGEALSCGNAVASESSPVPGDCEQSELTRSPRGRPRVPSRVAHAVRLRDQARCTVVDATGQRCENRRYLELHHIRPVALGGTDEANNLTCLCSEHHSLIHQLSFGIDGQVSWL